MRVKRIYYFLIYFLLVNYSFALMISEIQFDPAGSDTDREWIEIYNDSVNNLDLTQIKFFENNVNHSIDIFNLPNSTEKEISAGEYVVLAQDIAKFKTDFPNYVSKIFKSSFSLSNTGENLALKDKDGNILHSVNYIVSETGAGNGLSISINNSGGIFSQYKSINATPGAQNIFDPNAAVTSTTTMTTNENNSTSTDSNISNTSTPDPNYYYRSYWPDSEKIYVNAGENKVVLLGEQILFNPKVLDNNKKEIKNGLQYKWNFGDGNISEKKEGNNVYKFTGEYVVNLNVNYYGITETDKFYIKVIEPKLSLKIVNKEIEIGTTTKKEFLDLIEIKNENNLELELGGLILTNENNKKFILPNKFSVLPKRSILLSPELTGFASTTNRIELSLSTGKILNIFEKNLANTKTNLIQNNLSLKNLEKSENKNQVSVTTIEEFEKINQLATKTNSNIAKNKILKKKITQSNNLTNLNLEKNNNKVEFKNEEKLVKFDFLGKLKGMWNF